MKRNKKGMSIPEKVEFGFYWYAEERTRGMTLAEMEEIGRQLREVTKEYLRDWKMPTEEEFKSIELYVDMKHGPAFISYLRERLPNITFCDYPRPLYLTRK